MYVACVAQFQISLAAIASGEELHNTHNDIHHKIMYDAVGIAFNYDVN